MAQKHSRKNQQIDNDQSVLQAQNAPQLSNLQFGNSYRNQQIQNKERQNPKQNFTQAISGAAREVPYRSEMESIFSADFSNVKSYFGQEKNLSGINANAATDGQNIAFSAQNPSKETVAHELTHVVQAQNAGGGGVHLESKLSNSNEGSEKEAYRVASQVTSGQDINPITQRLGAGIAREENDAESNTEQQENEQQGEEQDEIVYDNRLRAEVEGQMADRPEYEKSSNPVQVLQNDSERELGSDPVLYGTLAAIQRTAEAAYEAYKECKDSVDDYATLMSELRRLRSEHDNEEAILPKTMYEEFKSRSSLFRKALRTTVGDVPSISEREYLYESLFTNEYDCAYTRSDDSCARFTPEARKEIAADEADFKAEAQWVNSRIQEVERNLYSFQENIVSARQEVQPYIQELVAEDLGQDYSRMNIQTFGTLPLFPVGNEERLKNTSLPIVTQRDFQQDLHRQDENITNYQNISESSDITGESLKAARQRVEQDRTDSQNQVDLGKAEIKVAYFRSQTYKKLDELSDKILEVGSSDVLFSRDYRDFESKIDDKLFKFDDIKADFVPQNHPHMTDGSSYLRAVNTLGESILEFIQQNADHYAQMSQSKEALDDFIREAESHHDTADRKIYRELPNMRNAVVQYKLKDRYEEELEWGQKYNTRFEETGRISVAPDTIRTRTEQLSTHAELIDASVGPKWFQYTSIIDELVKTMEAEGYSPEDIEEAKGKQAMGKTLNKYDRWLTLIREAKKSVIKRNGPNRDADLAEIERFERQVYRDFATELGIISDEHPLDDIKANLESASGNLDRIIAAPEYKDLMEPETYLRKLGVDLTWKHVIKDPQLRKNIGSLKGGVDKAVTVVDIFQKLRSVSNMGDDVSLLDQGTHPFMDGLADGLEIVNTFNKVPGFGQLMSGYISVIRSLSQQLAKLEVMMKEKKLNLTILSGRLNGPL